MQLTWKTSSLLSACHGNWVLQASNKRVVASGLAESVLACGAENFPAASFTSTANAEFWTRLLGHVARHMDFASTARAIHEELNFEGSTDDVETWLQQLDQAFREWRPNFEHDIHLRIQPIRAQWESYGPGILYQVKQLTGERPASATIYLVEPVAAGLGLSYPESQACHIEAVLTDSQPHLPEVLRLAWHIAQLAPDEKPLLGESAKPYSLLIPVLVAGAELGLCSFDSETLHAALEHWFLGHERFLGHNREPEKLSDSLMQWWNAGASQHLSWADSVGALSAALQ